MGKNKFIPREFILKYIINQLPYSNNVSNGCSIAKIGFKFIKTEEVVFMGFIIYIHEFRDTFFIKEKAIQTPNLSCDD